MLCSSSVINRIRYKNIYLWERGLNIHCLLDWQNWGRRRSTPSSQWTRSATLWWSFLQFASYKTGLRCCASLLRTCHCHLLCHWLDHLVGLSTVQKLCRECLLYSILPLYQSLFVHLRIFPLIGAKKVFLGASSSTRQREELLWWEISDRPTRSELKIPRVPQS